MIVEAEFASFQDLLRIRSGDRFEVTSRVVYRVSGKRSDFPYDEISFIVRDSYPTPESGAMEKRLPQFFTAGSRARFWMSKRPYHTIWDIQTYEIWDSHGHYGPEA